jgi:hypothetical protein
MSTTIKPAFNPADMRFLGALQQNQPISDGSGGQTDNWVTIVTTRCSLVKRSGKLMNNAGRIEYFKDYILVCRFQAAIVISTDSQWVINGEEYDIKDYDKVDLIPHLYQFTVTKNQ